MPKSLEEKVIPTGYHILCKRVFPPDMVHGIIIPPDAKQRLMKWEVLAKGDEVTKYKVGDIVLISWFLGIPMDVLHEEIDNKNYKLFMEPEIVGIWRE